MDQRVLLCQLHILYILRVCVSAIIYHEVYIHVMCVEAAEVNPVASHTSQLAGC